MDTTTFILRISKQRQLTLPQFLDSLGFKSNQAVKAYVNEVGNLEIEKADDQIQSLKGILKNKTKRTFNNIFEARSYALKAKYKRK